MMDEDPIYKAFMEALHFNVAGNWHRKKHALARAAGTSPGYLGDILNMRTKASFQKRKALAEACGYAYEDFLRLGRRLAAGGPEDKPEVSPAPKKRIPEIYKKARFRNATPVDVDGFVGLGFDCLDKKETIRIQLSMEDIGVMFSALLEAQYFFSGIQK